MWPEIGEKLFKLAMWKNYDLKMKCNIIVSWDGKFGSIYLETILCTSCSAPTHAPSPPPPLLSLSGAIVPQ